MPNQLKTIRFGWNILKTTRARRSAVNPPASTFNSILSWASGIERRNRQDKHQTASLQWIVDEKPELKCNAKVCANQSVRSTSYIKHLIYSFCQKIAHAVQKCWSLGNARPPPCLLWCKNARSEQTAHINVPLQKNTA